MSLHGYSVLRPVLRRGADRPGEARRGPNKSGGVRTSPTWRAVARGVAPGGALARRLLCPPRDLTAAIEDTVISSSSAECRHETPAPAHRDLKKTLRARPRATPASIGLNSYISPTLALAQQAWRASGGASLMLVPAAAGNDGPETCGVAEPQQAYQNSKCS
eukprot:gene21295-28227_t